MAEYFKIGYVGNPNLKESDFARYSMQELKNMMKTQAKRLNTRLSSLEKEGMTGGYAYEKANLWAFDEEAGLHSRTGKPRFETRVNVYDDSGLFTRERTRQEIIEQLVRMGKWESYSTSTVSGMMAMYHEKYENMKEHGFNGTFEQFIDTATSDAYETIRKYYGSDTAEYIVSQGESAAEAFIEAHPEYFTNDNPFDGQGGLLESAYAAWYQANWETVTDIISEDDFINLF